MRTIEIIGYKRANLGKADAKKLRVDGNVPCVLYGGGEQIHFSVPMILFRELVYTPNSAFIKLNIEGDEYDAILQDVQFHPVNELILHADFLELQEGRLIKMDIPFHFTGEAPGLLQGGKLMVKLRKVTIKALPKDMPEFIDMDVSGLDLGDSIKIKDIEVKDFAILNNPRITIATVSVPRMILEEEPEEEEELEEGAEGAEGEEGSTEGSKEGPKEDSKEGDK